MSNSLYPKGEVSPGDGRWVTLARTKDSTFNRPQISIYTTASVSSIQISFVYGVLGGAYLTLPSVSILRKVTLGAAGHSVDNITAMLLVPMYCLCNWNQSQYKPTNANQTGLYRKTYRAKSTGKAYVDA